MNLQLDLPPSHRSRCSVCQQPTRILVHHEHVIRYRSATRLIAWDECFACNAEADARAVDLQREAEEDRRVKLPEAPRTRRESNSLSFAQQIEEGE